MLTTRPGGLLFYLLLALPAKERVRLRFLKRHGRLPRLKDPKTFSEKVAWRKIYQRDPRFVTWSDKIAVKDLVATLVGERYVIPTLWVGTEIDEAPLEELPTPYVIKASTGSGINAFIHRSSDIDRTALRKQFQRLAKMSQHLEKDEWFYGEIPPRIVIEPMLPPHPGERSPRDYKFHVFHGAAQFIQVDADRGNSKHCRSFFDTTWQHLSFEKGAPQCRRAIQKPEQLEEMIRIAELIGRRFDYVRVDLYASSAVHFGECTFTPAAGKSLFDPPAWDEEWGRQWMAGGS